MEEDSIQAIKSGINLSGMPFRSASTSPTPDFRTAWSWNFPALFDDLRTNPRPLVIK